MPRVQVLPTTMYSMQVSSGPVFMSNTHNLGKLEAIAKLPVFAPIGFIGRPEVGSGTRTWPEPLMREPRRESAVRGPKAVPSRQLGGERGPNPKKSSCEVLCTALPFHVDLVFRKAPVQRLASSTACKPAAPCCPKRVGKGGWTLHDLTFWAFRRPQSLIRVPHEGRPPMK